MPNSPLCVGFTFHEGYTQCEFERRKIVDEKTKLQDIILFKAKRQNKQLNGKISNM